MVDDEDDLRGEAGLLPQALDGRTDVVPPLRGVGADDDAHAERRTLDPHAGRVGHGCCVGAGEELLLPSSRQRYDHMTHVRYDAWGQDRRRPTCSECAAASPFPGEQIRRCRRWSAHGGLGRALALVSGEGFPMWEVHRPDERVDDPPAATTPAPVSPPRPAGRMRSCTCGHPKAAHKHHRRGTDCALCGCVAYKGRLRALLQHIS